MRRRVQLASLFALSVLSSAAEVVSLGAVLPFLAVLVSPAQVFNYPLVGEFAEALAGSDPRGLILPATVAFITAALVAGAIRILLLWATNRLAFAIGADLSTAMYRRTLYQPYLTHIARNSSEVLSGITRKIDHVVTGVLLPVLTLAGSAVLILAVSGALFAIDVRSTTVALVGFGACYGAITVFSRRRIQRLSRQMAEKQTHVFKALQEGLNGIRDVLISGAQEHYSNIYRAADLPLRRAYGDVIFISQSPRYAMEALGMVLIAMLAYMLATQPGGVGATLPVLGALALGGQRLLPSLQQGYAAWSSIVGGKETLRDTLLLLDQPLPPEASEPAPPPLPFAQELRLEGVSFRYGSDEPWIIEGLDLTIRKGERIGLIGATGSGKSTVADILMGLLSPTTGHLLVDGKIVDSKDARGWRRNVRHVPQSIYLTDASFAENIALGEPQEAVDMERAVSAARQAHIADYIESRPLGYEERVGEDGVRLSGGQRQRIGIARALYARAALLVFDEATSALDMATERSVMEAIDTLDPELTIILIAHRISTLRRCNRIIELVDGRVVRESSYDALSRESVGDGD